MAGFGEVMARVTELGIGEEAGRWEIVCEFRRRRGRATGKFGGRRSEFRKGVWEIEVASGCRDERLATGGRAEIQAGARRGS